jgi:hypothetical protein
MRANDINSFLNTASLRHDVFDNEDVFAGGDFESASEYELAFFFFDEDKAES